MQTDASSEKRQQPFLKLTGNMCINYVNETKEAKT